MTSRMITMVGQWAFVNDQSDDACAACGTVFAVAGWVCATVGADGVVAGVVAAGGALFTATGEPATGVTATGADAGDVAAAGAGAGVLLPAVATVFAIATSVLCIPLRVAATDASCEGVSVVLAATEALNCVSVIASVFKVP